MQPEVTEQGAIKESVLATLPVIDVRSAEPLTSTTSKGNQLKWYLEKRRLFVKGRFFTSAGAWKDFVVEQLASTLGAQLGWEVIPQQMCRIQTNTMVYTGSCSLNFLRDTEQFVTFHRMYRTLPFTEFPQEWATLSASERMELTILAYKQVTGLDMQEYIWRMVTLDLLVGNEDRHMNNFGVIFSTEDQQYRPAPLFDFGLGLFEHDVRYANLTLPQSIMSMRFKPFGIDQRKAYNEACDLFGYSMEGVVINIDGLYFPSKKALDYFQFVCLQIDIDLQGEGIII